MTVPVEAARQLMRDLSEVWPVQLAIVDAEGRPIAASPDAYDGSGAAAEAPITVSGRIVGQVRAGSPDRDGGGRCAAIARLAAHVLADRTRLEAELDGMAEEVLSRYEEITMLFDLGEALGAVFETEEICRISLERARAATRAHHGLTLLAGEGGNIVEAGGLRSRVAAEVAHEVAVSGRLALLHEGQEAVPRGEGEALIAPAPLLAVPLMPMTGGEAGVAALGALVLMRAPGAPRFTAGDAKLATSVAMQLANAIRSSELVASLRAAERLQRDVEIAGTVQRALLPGSPPDVPGLELSGACVPAANIGGDLYDHMVDDQGRVWLVIADVAGHSVGSALVMAMARTVLRREIAEGRSPADVLAATNAALFADLAASDLFITAFCARLEPSTGEMRFASGGQNPPLLRRPGGELVALDADGMPAGFLPDTEYEERGVTLGDRDLLILYTDGVVEAQAGDGAMFGEDRLSTLVSEAGEESAAGLVQLVLRRVDEFAGGIRADDVTLLAARVGGRS